MYIVSAKFATVKQRDVINQVDRVFAHSDIIEFEIRTDVSHLSGFI